MIKTRAIVLHRFPYSDSSWIVKVLAEESGIVSFIVKGGKRKDGVEIVPNDDPKITTLLKELWATGDTQKVADGVLGAEFIWQENLNKIPGLNAMLKQDLDLIESLGMLEALKSIL